ncbi:DapH/DapD/GlmU-related protein [Pseudomonas sp. SG20052]|uniref:serine O-acetyltransferase n=1 Tax=Pseudomonas sp. SG20052 TaxID=3074147 RepID=UPI00287FC2A3|nr:DapH/DapD/GlmU-related protein [Pseudomonas sp. SG20052]WNF57346.1 DapH/DapD/GlmU-related protein [Pseudomonas sp. SG20052]
MEKQEPGLRQLLVMDVQRHRELFGSQPLESKVKVWLSMFSPRFIPVLLCRLAYKSHTLGAGVLARMFSLLNFLLFGIEIATTCKIGPGLFFPHTHGTVIGAVSIGKNAIIYQGVTLGAKDLDFTYDAAHRPIVGDDVFIGAGAKILGGLTIGDNVAVAANAVLLESAPDDVVVGGVPAKIIKYRKV